MAIILLQDSDDIPRRGKTTASYLSYVPHDFYPYSSLYQTPWASCAICQTIPSFRCAMCQIPPSTSVLVRLNHISSILIAPILSFAMQQWDFFLPSLIFNTFSVSFLFLSRSAVVWGVHCRKRFRAAPPQKKMRISTVRIQINRMSM